MINSEKDIQIIFALLEGWGFELSEKQKSVLLRHIDEYAKSKKSEKSKTYICTNKVFDKIEQSIFFVDNFYEFMYVGINGTGYWRGKDTDGNDAYFLTEVFEKHFKLAL